MVRRWASFLGAIFARVPILLPFYGKTVVCPAWKSARLASVGWNASAAHDYQPLNDYEKEETHLRRAALSL